MKKTISFLTVVLGIMGTLCFAGCNELMIGPNRGSGSSSGGGVTPTPDPTSNPYLTFKGNDYFELGINAAVPGSKAWDGIVEYSTDKVTWQEWKKTDTSTISSSAVVGGEAYIYLRGKNTYFSDGSDYTVLEFTGLATSVECSGNIMTLLDYDNPSDAITKDYCYAAMFYGCAKLKAAPELPATVLTEACYLSMFAGCFALKAAPALPATAMKINCYQSMFYGCIALESAPTLPATVLEDSCYKLMFSDCVKLKEAPALPATILAKSCYNQMFAGCTALTTAPPLPATTLKEYCYAEMFSGCTALEAAPALPAETLVNNCYDSMFIGCSSLVSIGKIKATSIDKNYAMFSMFSGCSKLKVEIASKPSEAFVTITSTKGMDPVTDMFKDCSLQGGATDTPIPGKSYKN